ncbi:MAG: IS1634 family transposase [Sphaerochaeta sp.]|nr:IS1634 family transposase [Sphaerochaeta sp.]
MYVTTSGIEKYRVVQFREDIRIPGTNKKKTNIIRTVGKYADLLAQDPDFMQKLKEEAKRLTKERKESERPLLIEADMREIATPGDVTPSFLFGHAIIARLWQIMGLDSFLEKNCSKRNAKDVRDAICYLMVQRCSNPDSIRMAASDQSRYAGIAPIGLEVFYSVLDVLSQLKEALEEHLCSFFRKRTTRKVDITCYNISTYALEGTKWGVMGLFGFSKDHKDNAVQVVMGVLMDANGIPITYELFPGNTMGKNTLKDSITKLKAMYGLDEITIVADSGMNAKDKLLFLHGEDYHFIVSYTLKRSRQEFKDAVFNDETPWEVEHFDGKTGKLTYASKILKLPLNVKVERTAEEVMALGEQRELEKKRRLSPKYKEENIEANVHVTYSMKRAEKDVGERNRMLERLVAKAEVPEKLRGGNQYLQMVLDTGGAPLDEARILNAAKFDGYYAVVTDHMDLKTEEVMSIYRDQRKMGESFRVQKTDLQARPVFIWTDNHIKGHFAMCYISLCIIKYLQYYMQEKGMYVLSAEVIMRAISQPRALVQGQFPKNIVTPIEVSQSYLDIASLLKLPPLLTNMGLTKFKVATKLDLKENKF